MGCTKPNCRICYLSKKREEASTDFTKAQEFIDELLNDLCCSEEDNAINDCIMSGEWPSSTRYLTGGLVKSLLLDLEDAEKPWYERHRRPNG